MESREEFFNELRKELDETNDLIEQCRARLIELSDEMRYEQGTMDVLHHRTQNLNEQIRDYEQENHPIEKRPVYTSAGNK